MLKLLRKMPNGALEELDKVVVGDQCQLMIKKAKIKISPNSKYLMIYMRELHEIQIYKIPEVESGNSTDAWKQVFRDI